MHLSTFLSPLGFLNAVTSGQVFSFCIVFAAFVLVGTITITALYFHHQRRRLWHETARLALEKGQPLPVEVVTAAVESARPARLAGVRNDFRSGLILIAVGAGLFFFFTGIRAEPLRYVGAIPGFIGVALLLHALFSALLSRKPADRPPQS